MEIKRIRIENFDDLEEAKKILPKEIYEEIVKELKEENIDIAKHEERKALNKALDRVTNVLEKIIADMGTFENKSVEQVRIIRKAFNSCSQILEKAYKEEIK